MSAATGAASMAPTYDINVGKEPNTTTGPTYELITPLFLFLLRLLGPGNRQHLCLGLQHNELPAPAISCQRAKEPP